MWCNAHWIDIIGNEVYHWVVFIAILSRIALYDYQTRNKRYFQINRIFMRIFLLYCFNGREFYVGFVNIVNMLLSAISFSKISCDIVVVHVVFVVKGHQRRKRRHNLRDFCCCLGLIYSFKSRRVSWYTQKREELRFSFLRFQILTLFRPTFVNEKLKTLTRLHLLIPIPYRKSIYFSPILPE